MLISGTIEKALGRRDRHSSEIVIDKPAPEVGARPGLGARGGRTGRSERSERALEPPARATRNADLIGKHAT